jgi:hypothetical protein
MKVEVRDWTSIEEATGTAYTEINSLFSRFIQTV